MAKIKSFKPIVSVKIIKHSQIVLKSPEKANWKVPNNNENQFMFGVCNHLILYLSTNCDW